MVTDDRELRDTLVTVVDYADAGGVDIDVEEGAGEFVVAPCRPNALPAGGFGFADAEDPNMSVPKADIPGLNVIEPHTEGVHSRKENAPNMGDCAAVPLNGDTR